MLVRLLHAKPKDIPKYLKNIKYYQIIIKLLYMCDQYSICDIVPDLLDRFQEMADHPPIESDDSYSETIGLDSDGPIQDEITCDKDGIYLSFLCFPMCVCVCI